MTLALTFIGGIATGALGMYWAMLFIDNCVDAALSSQGDENK